MARASAVDYRQVAEACYQLFQRGEPVSFQRVYDLIGNKGSGRVVNDYIKTWRQEAGEKLSVSFSRNLPGGLPDALVATADELLVQLWQGALASAEESYQEARRQLDQVRAEMEAEREREKAVLQEQQLLASRLGAELQAAQTGLEEKDAALRENAVRRHEQDALLRQRDAQLGALREEVARLSATLENTQRQHAVAIADTQARGEERLAQARQAHLQEMEREREVAAGERAYLMQITDELRQAARHGEAKLQAEIAALRESCEAARHQATQAGDESARWQGRAEIAEALIERLTSRKRRKPAPPDGPKNATSEAIQGGEG